VSYDGYGTKRITLRGGNEHGAPDGSDPTTTIALGAIGERTLTGTLSAPDDFVNDLRFYVGPLPTDFLEIPPGDYSTLLPVGAGDLPTYVEVESLRELVNGTEDVVTIFQIDDSTTELDLSSPSPPATPSTRGPRLSGSRILAGFRTTAPATRTAGSGSSRWPNSARCVPASLGATRTLA
jgi:hypothetical protein